MSTDDPLTFHVVFKGQTLVILGFNSNICVNYLLCRTTTVYVVNIESKLFNDENAAFFRVNQKYFICIRVAKPSTFDSRHKKK